MNPSAVFTYWKDNNIPNIKKQNLRTDRYDWLRLLSLSLDCLSAVSLIQYVRYYEESKSGSNVNELRYRMFTKNNLSGNRFP